MLDLLLSAHRSLASSADTGAALADELGEFLRIERHDETEPSEVQQQHSKQHSRAAYTGPSQRPAPILCASDPI
jgi:hypothetical protein